MSFEHLIKRQRRIVFGTRGRAVPMRARTSPGGSASIRSTVTGARLIASGGHDRQLLSHMEGDVSASPAISSLAISRGGTQEFHTDSCIDPTTSRPDTGGMRNNHVPM